METLTYSKTEEKLFDTDVRRKQRAVNKIK